MTQSNSEVVKARNNEFFERTLLCSKNYIERSEVAIYPTDMVC
jgi:hypothetical protein